MTREPGLERQVRAALAEDVGAGDVTTAATVPADLQGVARILARAPGVVAGLALVAETYRQADRGVAFSAQIADGARVEAGTTIAIARGSFAALLTAERTALNFLQHLSGVATLTARFVEAVQGTGARIVDTRKTTPGWRALEKAAVLAGGGHNHRMGLDDAYLIKENHIAGAGSVDAALTAVMKHNTDGKPVEIEVRSLDDLARALAFEPRPDRILCDNFPVDRLAFAVREIRARDPHIVVEASGNVILSSVGAIAATGVDWISVGALSHSAPALDVSCLIEPI